MLIKITFNTFCDGKPVKIGDVVDATDMAAKTLIGMQRAVKHEPDQVEPQIVEEKKKGKK